MEKHCGSLSYIFEYFKKIKLVSDHLTNIDSPISEKNLIMYAVNGLTGKYEHVASILCHTESPLSLMEARFMLLLEESHLSCREGHESNRDTHSSSTVLLASGLEIIASLFTLVVLRMVNLHNGTLKDVPLLLTLLVAYGLISGPPICHTPTMELP
ncbi:hypothetical protein Tco_1009845 [Tanacetum coccineum]